MRYDKNQIVVLLITLGVLLLFASILVQTGPARHREPWRLYPKDVAHWFGWMSTFTMMASSSYPFLKRIAPKGIKRWLDLHCALGAMSLPLIVVHLYNRLSRIRPVHFVSFYTFGLMIVIVTSGIVRRVMPTNRFIGAYWKVLHFPLSIAFYITLGYHVIQKLAII